MVNADVVIDVFESAISCLTSLLSTDVGAWLGGILVLLGVIRIFKALQNI